MDVLLIGAAPHVAERLAAALRAHGHVVAAVAPADGYLAALAGGHDVALLVVEHISADLPRSPLFALELPSVVFAQRADALDIVACLDAGAADAVTSPGRLAEIIARLRAVARRAAPASDSELVVGELVLDPAGRRAWRQRYELRLSAREFDLLATFMTNPGRVLSRPVLADAVWDRDPSSNIVDQYVGHLRRKVDRPFGTHDIQTVRGAGYRLAA